MASCSPRLRRTRRMVSDAPKKRTPRRTAAPPSSERLDWSAASQQPPVPIEELLAEEEGDHRHAAQKDSERHLVMPVHGLRGVPGAPAGGVKRQVAPLDKPSGSSDPDQQDRAHSENRSGKRRGEDREHSELNAEE